MKRYGKGLLVCLAAAVGAAVMLGSTCSVLNKAPSVPVISGPSAGVVGVPVTFKATATDPDGDSVAFQFDWGDTGTLTWTSPVASGETTAVAHAYSDSGAFAVRAKAKDAKGKASGWTAERALSVLAKAAGAYPDSVYAEIPIPAGGCAGAITPDGKYLYVASGQGSMKVTPIRLADRTALPAIQLESDPNDIVSSVDGAHVFVTLDDADKVLSIRTSDNTIDHEVSVAHRPQRLAVTPDGQLLLATVIEPYPGYVLFLSATDLTVVDTMLAGGGPQTIVIDHAGERGYTNSVEGLMILDLDSRTIEDSVVSVPNPGEVGLSRDGAYLFAASQKDSGFVVVRLPDLTIERRVNVRDRFLRALVTTSGDDYLILSYQHGIKYVDMRAYAVVDSLVLGENRRALVVHPAADTVYMVGYKAAYLIGPR